MEGFEGGILCPLQEEREKWKMVIGNGTRKKDRGGDGGEKNEGVA